MVWDEAREIVLATVPGPSGGALRTWQWNGLAWSESYPPDAPPTRGFPGLVPTANGVLSFGGFLPVSGLPFFSDRRWLRTSPLASVSAFGAPGATAAGPLELRATGYGPWLGSQFDTGLAALPAIALPALWAGFSNEAWNGVPLPIDLGPVGWPGTQLRITLDILFPVLNLGNGTAVATFELATTPSLIGIEVHLQAMVYEPLSGALTTSNGLTLVIGLR